MNTRIASADHDDTAPRVSLVGLRELWVHTGTACNLECPFCFEGSRPGDTRIDRIGPNELKPLLDEAAALGVERFCFTGGEPLIVKDIVKILSHALTLRPCLVITNGTAPLLKRAHQLSALRQLSHPLRFRVSIDHPDEKRHDEGRGWGNFKRAVEGIKVLLTAGFEVEVAGQCSAGQAQIAEQAFERFFRDQRLPRLPLLLLPDLGRPGSSAASPPLSEAQVAGSTRAPMCATTRMLVKRAGQVRVQACAFTDDDTRFELGASLQSSLVPVALRHSRCQLCILHGATLS